MTAIPQILTRAKRRRLTACDVLTISGSASLALAVALLPFCLYAPGLVAWVLVALGVSLAVAGVSVACLPG